MTNPARGFDPEKFMTKRQVADFFKVHPRTIDNWTRKGHLNRRKVGLTHFVVYSRSEVEELQRRFDEALSE